MISKTPKKPPPRPDAAKKPGIAAFQAVDVKVRIKTSAVQRSLEIRFFSAADLERLLGILLDKN